MKYKFEAHMTFGFGTGLNASLNVIWNTNTKTTKLCYAQNDQGVIRIL